MSGQKGRRENVKRNILFSLLDVIVSLLLPFILRTILIYYWGVVYLGLNSLFASILNVLSLMELGFGTAVVYSMYKPAADNDVNLICAYLLYYKKIYRIIGLVVLGIGLSIIPFLKYLILDTALPGELNLYVCYLIYLGDTVISYLLFGYKTAIPMAYQRMDILSCINMGMVTLKCFLQALIIISGIHVYVYFLAIPTVTIIRNLIVARLVDKKYPSIECKGDLSESQKKDLLHKVLGLLVNKITWVSRNSIDCLFISAFIGLTATGVYSNYYFVLSALLSLSGAICNSMMASVGNSIAVESRDKNYNDLCLFDFIYMAIAGWATSCLLCLYQPFISIWLGNNMMLSKSVVIGLSLYFYILKSGDIRWVYHEGTGLWYECRFIMIGEAAMNIILNALLCKNLGVFGIVLATVISVFITNMILCPRLIFRLYFKREVREYWLAHIKYFMNMLISSVISYVLCDFIFSNNNALTLIGRLAVCTVVSVVVFMLIWNRSERYRAALLWLQKTYIGQNPLS